MKLLHPVISEPLTQNRTLEQAIADYEAEERIQFGLLFENEMMEEADGSGVEFKGCIFQSCRLSNCIFEKASFVDVIFRGCDLSNCKLAESVFHRVEFDNCKLLGAGLEEAYLRNVSFNRCGCGYLSMSHGDLKSVRFAGCDLSGAGLPDCKFIGEFQDCKLTATNLFRTSLSGVDLTSCVLDGICIAMEDLKGAVVTAEQAAELARLMGLVIK